MRVSMSTVSSRCAVPSGVTTMPLGVFCKAPRRTRACVTLAHSRCSAGVRPVGRLRVAYPCNTLISAIDIGVATFITVGFMHRTYHRLLEQATRRTMRAIIITDAESLALLDSLELTKLREANLCRNTETNREAMEEAHRVYHYVVTRWLQSVGAETVRR